MIPTEPKPTLWQVQSDEGLEGIFYTKQSAEDYADDLRGIGARGLKVSPYSHPADTKKASDAEVTP